jgi:hypothetical protein
MRENLKMGNWKDRESRKSLKMVIFFFNRQNIEKIIYGSFKNGEIRSIDILTDHYEIAKQ